MGRVSPSGAGVSEGARRRPVRELLQAAVPPSAAEPDSAQGRLLPLHRLQGHDSQVLRVAGDGAEDGRPGAGLSEGEVGGPAVTQAPAGGTEHTQTGPRRALSGRVGDEGRLDACNSERRMLFLAVHR